ncbi:prepilin-type N-terminal cleavage/methylation domain-containing protein [Rhodanobacter sp. Soil772]|uniref:type IV pilus modification PilV family protein n=1 Tax=Rhodanobacter sp. Soil772 TaxID=1736406 RepID=UPI0009EA0063|nr:prepilin-type N-terminal cleavage/methylation domain-containing protein [Rhodanobacter sp. Soil772]
MRAGIGDSGFEIRKSGRPALARLAESPIPNPQSRHQNGFSLLEVIAAIMLLAIAFTALMKVAGASISLTHNAAEHSEAAMWARSLLDSAFVGEPVKPGSRSGRFNPQYRWQLDVTPWNQAGPALPGAPLQLYQLDLAVSWGPPAHPRSAHFRTLRLGGPVLANDAQVSP